MMRWILGLVAAGILVASPTFAREPIWVGSWACSPQLVEPQNQPPDPGLAGNTLRQVVHVTLAISEIRLRFSSEFGRTPLTLGSVHIALPASAVAGSIRQETDHAVTFGGNSGVSIPAGALMYSDPIAFPVAVLSDLVVTFKTGIVPAGITGHPGSRETSYLAAGDEVSAATLTSPVTADHWYVLAGVDVQAKSDVGGMVALDDSITDGRGSITNENTRWPDDLARLLAGDKRAANFGVLNHGIGGNCILHDGLGLSNEEEMHEQHDQEGMPCHHQFDVGPRRNCARGAIRATAGETFASAGG